MTSPHKKNVRVYLERYCSFYQRNYNNEDPFELMAETPIRLLKFAWFLQEDPSESDPFGEECCGLTKRTAQNYVRAVIAKLNQKHDMTGDYRQLPDGSWTGRVASFPALARFLSSGTQTSRLKYAESYSESAESSQSESSESTKEQVVLEANDLEFTKCQQQVVPLIRKQLSESRLRRRNDQWRRYCEFYKRNFNNEDPCQISAVTPQRLVAYGEYMMGDPSQTDSSGYPCCGFIGSTARHYLYTLTAHMKEMHEGDRSLQQTNDVDWIKQDPIFAKFVADTRRGISPQKRQRLQSLTASDSNSALDGSQGDVQIKDLDRDEQGQIAVEAYTDFVRKYYPKVPNPFARTRQTPYVLVDFLKMLHQPPSAADEKGILLGCHGMQLKAVKKYQSSLIKKFDQLYNEPYRYRKSKDGEFRGNPMLTLLIEDYMNGKPSTEFNFIRQRSVSIKTSQPLKATDSFVQSALPSRLQSASSSRYVLRSTVDVKQVEQLYFDMLRLELHGGAQYRESLCKYVKLILQLRTSMHADDIDNLLIRHIEPRNCRDPINFTIRYNRVKFPLSRCHYLCPVDALVRWLKLIDVGQLDQHLLK